MAGKLMLHFIFSLTLPSLFKFSKKDIKTALNLTQMIKQASLHHKMLDVGG